MSERSEKAVELFKSGYNCSQAVFAAYADLSLEPDMNTVKGIVMDHSGETPGLGAEITTSKVQSSFVGKTIFEGDNFVSVSMRKGGATNNHEVDAISGGTKTCDGVNAMLQSGLGNYRPYFNANKSNK